MEGQGDERLEPPRLVLKLTQADQVIDPVQGLVDMAVEHGRVRMQPQPVGRAVDVEPLLGRGLGAADLLANLGMEDLGSATRQTAQPGVNQLPEDLLGGEPGDLGEELDLDRRVRLDMNLGGRLLDPPHHVHIVREWQLVMQSADDVQLRRPPLAGLPGPIDHRGTIHHISLGLVQVGAEGTEITSVHAHVGRIDVRIDVVYPKLPLYRSRTRLAIAPRANRSLEASRARPSSRLRRVPASTFSRIASNRVNSVAMPSSFLSCIIRRELPAIRRLPSIRLGTGAIGGVSEILGEIEAIINLRWTDDSFDSHWALTTPGPPARRRAVPC